MRHDDCLFYRRLDAAFTGKELSAGVDRYKMDAVMKTFRGLPAVLKK